MIIPFRNIPARAGKGVAPAFQTTALVEARVGAVCIIAQDVRSIISEQVTSWAIKHGAPTLLACTCVQILKCASFVFAFDLRIARFQNVASGW
jgi:hypothetical protein